MKKYVVFLTFVDLCLSSTREEAIDRITKGVLLYNTWNLTATSNELCTTDLELAAYLSKISHQRTLLCSSGSSSDLILDTLSHLRSDSLMGSESLQSLLRPYLNFSFSWNCGDRPPLSDDSSVLKIATTLITEGLMWLMNRETCNSSIDVDLTDSTVLHQRMQALKPHNYTRASVTCMASAINSADAFLSGQLTFPEVKMPMIPDICFPVIYNSFATIFVPELTEDSRGLITIPTLNGRISVHSNLLIDPSPVCPMLRGNAADCSTKDLWSCDAVEGCYVDWENSICADTPPGFYSTSMSSIIPCTPIAADQYYVGVGWTNPNCPSKCIDSSMYLVSGTCEPLPSLGYTVGSCDSDNSLYSCLLDQRNKPYIDFPVFGACDPAYWKYLITVPVTTGDLDFSVWYRTSSNPLNPVRLIGLVGGWELWIQNSSEFLLVANSNVTKHLQYLNPTDWFNLKISQDRIWLDGTHELFDQSDFVEDLLDYGELFLGPDQPTQMEIFQPRWIPRTSLTSYNYVEPPDGWARGTECLLRSELINTCQGEPILLNEYPTTTSTSPNPTTTYPLTQTPEETTSTTEYASSIPETTSSSAGTTFTITLTETASTTTESTSTSEPITTPFVKLTTSTMTDTVRSDPPTSESPKTSTFEPMTPTSTDTLPVDPTTDGTFGKSILDPIGGVTTTSEPRVSELSSTSSTSAIPLETTFTVTTSQLPITSDEPLSELTTGAQTEDMPTTPEIVTSSTTTEQHSETILILTTAATIQDTSATAEPNQQFSETPDPTSSSTTSEADPDSTSLPEVRDKHASSTTGIPDTMSTTTAKSSHESSTIHISILGTTPQRVETTSSAVSGDLVVHPSNKVDSYAQRGLDFKGWITAGIAIGLLFVVMLAICSCVTIVQRRRMTRPITQIQ